MARAYRCVEDVGLVEVTVVALAQVELVVELTDARGGLADLMPLKTALLLEFRSPLLLKL